MDDVSKLVQSASIEIDADKVVLPAVSIKDWGVIQTELKKRKRANILRSVLDLKEDLTPGEYEEMRSAALQEAGRVVAVSVADMQSMLTTEEGVCLIIWVLLDRKYPGKYTEEQVHGGMPTMGTEDADLIIGQLQTVLGIEDDDEDAEGNEEGAKAPKKRSKKGK